MDNSKGVYAKLVLAMIMLGSNSTASKVILTQIPPVTASLFRFSLMTVILLLYLGLFEQLPIPKRSDLLSFFAMGFTGVYLNNIFWLVGVKYSTAANASLINAIYPGMTAIFLFFLFKETLQKLKVIGILLSLLGVVVIVSKGSLAVILGLSFNLGDIFLLLTAITWPLYTIINLRLSVNYSPIVTTAYSGLVGSILFLPTALLMDSSPTRLASISFPVLLSLLCYSLLGGVLSYIWWNQGVAKLGSNRAAVFMNLVPLVGIIFAVFLLGEHIVLSQIAGGVLSISGIIVANISGKNKISVVNDEVIGSVRIWKR